MLLEENKPLASFTTFGIGGPARWYVSAFSEEDIVEAATWAREQCVEVFVLGGGSNLLVSDAGFNGLILHIQSKGIARESNQASVVYSVAAGEDWDEFVERTVQENCAGLECLAGIPGTVGGTPVQNVGAYGQEVASSIERVRGFDLDDEEFVEFTAKECHFAYRRSRFNSTDKGRFVVSRVDYRLAEGGKPSVRYADLQKAISVGPEPSLIEVAQTVRRIRQSKGMLLVEGDRDCQSAGSFFKNPIVDAEQATKIAATSGKEPPRFPVGSGADNERRVKVPAAWLIEQAGFAKGYARGNVGLSSRHTLALINRGGATAAEILDLATEISRAVEVRFGVCLEMEPTMLGFHAESS